MRIKSIGALRLKIKIAIAGLRNIKARSLSQDAYIQLQAACKRFRLRFWVNGVAMRNLFAGLPADTSREHVDALLESQRLCIERIVSFGQATPAGYWYDQERSEWVLLLKGSAGLLIEGEPDIRVLRVGDCILLPAHVRHRVEWTQAGEETIWLAVHFAD